MKDEEPLRIREPSSEPGRSTPDDPERRPSTPMDDNDWLLQPDHRTPPWMLRASCRDAAPGEFFPSDGVGVERARRVCAECPVTSECLEYALTYRIDHGVWGGCSERERRRILRQRRVTASLSAPAGPHR
jgi:WhiB family transcriptional regulator, redox-sensing transcriptional regulator